MICFEIHWTIAHYVLPCLGAYYHNVDKTISKNYQTKQLAKWINNHH